MNLKSIFLIAIAFSIAILSGCSSIPTSQNYIEAAKQASVIQVMVLKVKTDQYETQILAKSDDEVFSFKQKITSIIPTEGQIVWILRSPKESRVISEMNI